MQNCDIQRYTLACSHFPYEALLIQPGLSLMKTLYSAYFICSNVTGSNMTQCMFIINMRQYSNRQSQNKCIRMCKWISLECISLLQ